MSIYRVKAKISAWLEIEAKSIDDAIDAASDKDAVALVEDAVKVSWDLDEVELTT